MEGRVCLDIGASTGGFTDCLLQKGARRVFAVDCGTGQLDQKLRQNPKVTSLEKTNARYLTLDTLRAYGPEAEAISFVCIDASFISLALLVGPLHVAFPLARDWVFLFKPQFEVGPENLGKGGRVRNFSAVETALNNFDSFMTQQGFSKRHEGSDSPVTGKKSGNQEILLHYEKD
jgi:23S rRNA (cytidine1920-2'-O)/16S rRNA (cytidine1409-2'-O)-methyltransferase